MEEPFLSIILKDIKFQLTNSMQDNKMTTGRRCSKGMYEKPANPERRRYPRVSSAMPVQYRGIRQTSDATVGTVMRDISTGGIRFIANEFISVFTRLVVEISIPLTSKPVRAISKVVWIRKRPSGEQYELGMQFIDMTEEDRGNISNFVERSIPK
ncbi:MAG: PilZ domain-containing protein [Candidatus Omnitrophota bacterium]